MFVSLVAHPPALSPAPTSSLASPLAAALCSDQSFTSTLSRAMENSESKSGFLSLPTLRHRHSQPDVPEDVAVALLHLNDPNWETGSRAETVSIADSDQEQDKKPQYGAGSFEMGRSQRTGSEYDAESQTESRKHMPSMSTLDYEECVTSSILSLTIINPPPLSLVVNRLMPKYEQPCLTRTTQTCQ